MYNTTKPVTPQFHCSLCIHYVDYFLPPQLASLLPLPPYCPGVLSFARVWFAFPTRTFFCDDYIT